MTQKQYQPVLYFYRKEKNMAKKKETNEEPKMEVECKEVACKEPECSNTNLVHYLKACYPLIWVRTSEDARAVRHIIDAVEKANLSDCWIGEWKMKASSDKTCQLVVNGNNQKGYETVDKAFLYTAQRATDDQNGIMIIHNIRQFIGNFLVIQEIKDTAMICRVKGSYLILVGAEIDFPPELRDLVTVYDFQLPDREFFVKSFNGMIQKYEKVLTLPEKMEDRDALVKKAADAALGMTEVQGENAMALSIVKCRSVDLPVIYSEKEQAIKQSDVLELIRVDADSVDTLGGFDAFKPWISRRANTFGVAAKEYGLRPPRGVLLVGVPGCGKSLCAKVIANYLEVPLIRFDVGKVFRSLQGQSEAAVRSALKVAEAVSPCVLWIDEMEKSMAGTESSGKTDSGTTARVMQSILVWMQEKTSSVFVAATVNRVSAVPPELLRKGRFDEVFGVDLPSHGERVDITNIHIAKRGRKVEDYDSIAIANSSEFHTGAEIEAAIEDSMFVGFADGGREFTTEDIVSSLDSTTPQSEAQAEKINPIRDWINARTRLVSSKPQDQWNPKLATAAIEETRKIVADKPEEDDG
jgi:hypothetical protein